MIGQSPCHPSRLVPQHQQIVEHLFYTESENPLGVSHQPIADCNGTTIDVTLARQAETVHFFKTQLGDLKAVLRSITDEKRV